MLSHSEKNQIIIDYHNIRKLTPSTFDPSTLNGLEGIEGFIENPPPKILKIEDFFTEFDYLVYHYKIQTPIGRGDGRPFMYEVDALFKKQFPIQAKNWVLPLYEDAFITTKAQQEIIEQNSPDKNKKKTVTASDIHTPWNAFKDGGGEAKFGSLGEMLESSFKRQTQSKFNYLFVIFISLRFKNSSFKKIRMDSLFKYFPASSTMARISD